MLEQDTYRTISRPSSVSIFKDRGSKFLAYAYPLQEKEQVKELVEDLKKEHHKARHWCYAWQLGIDEVRFRVHDDGEPNNSAGQPIYGQILSKGLSNIIVIVVRYFGGTKLGVGGLVNAYKTAAQLALESSQIITRTIKTDFKLIFEYPSMNMVMRILKENKVTIKSQKMEMNCEFIISIRKKEVFNFKTAFEQIRHVKIVEL